MRKNERGLEEAERFFSLLSAVSILSPRHLRHPVRHQRHQAQPVRQELIVQDGGVDLDLDEVDGDRRDLCEK
jgi:hypothetical protein